MAIPSCFDSVVVGRMCRGTSDWIDHQLLAIQAYLGRLAEHRVGQRHFVGAIDARGGDVVVTAVVSFGAEVIADGNVHVYAPLRGKAIAGARGNTEARIFSTCMEAQLVAIAGIYRTNEVPLPDPVLGKPAQIRLDGKKLVIDAIP
jgi:septum site-determining protein MinC